ncbi:restriction endonuclease subunit S, partial [Helicobacter typhlonius]
VNNHAHILKTKENIANNKFICHFLNILDYTPYVSGTTRLKLNQSSMKQIKIPLPPLATQNQIVQILESKFTHLDNLAQFVNESLENLQKLKSSLLNQAFKGELIC